MGDTKIQWTGKTWNPIRARNKVTGKVGWFCEHVSEGCRNCYAEKMNVNTYFGNGLEYKPAQIDQVELFLDENILQQPLHWRKSTFVFPCSMTDLFGRWVTDGFLDRIFAVMARASQHTFQVLTKRADRMSEYLARHDVGLRWAMQIPDQYLPDASVANAWTNNGLPNVWLGVSVEDQKTADERLPLLLETPAAKHWASLEPLLSPLNLCGLGGCCGWRDYDLDWVVIGGESGPNARPFDLQWAREIIAELAIADNYVAAFVKQLGAKPIDKGEPLILKDKKGGDISEWPAELRVREFPNAA